MLYSGVLLGLALRFYKLDAFYIDMIAYPGELFMRLLKLMILPLVIASLIAGSASLNAKVGTSPCISQDNYLVGQDSVCTIKY